MNFLSVENLSKNYGERDLFENIFFGLAQGDKVALVANNGTGKSTLLNILAGTEDADSGKVIYRSGVRKAFLVQDPNYKEEYTIQEVIERSNATLRKVISDYEQVIEKQATDQSEAVQLAFETCYANMELFQAWDYDRKLENILHKFGLQDVQKKVNSLSGGQKKRLALALVLMDNPEFIVLDEPTNHLDIGMIEWLEDYLQQANLTILMVTHDRYFLDRVCNRIMELTDGKLYMHEGNYSYFVEKRAQREEVYAIEIDKAGKLMKKELEWMRRMPKARTTKSKARIDSFYEIEEKANSKKVQKELRLEVKMSRMGGKILEFKKVYKSYGDLAIVKGFDYTFRKGERIGIIGKNGVGKSTFLNMITSKEEPDSGKINVGDTIVFGYYSQAGMVLKEDKRVIEVVKEIADIITLGNGSIITASQFLQHFMFSPEMQFTFVSKLSGGEKRRLYLLTVLMKNPNFLILDEPTNDLDLMTLNKLEEFLENFPGCLLIVSHDRYFMDKLVDHLFVFEGDGQINQFTGNYTEYRIEQDEKAEEEEPVNQPLKSKIQTHRACCS
jgi:ATP-binding cassette subfamily F protein uup